MRGPRRLASALKILGGGLLTFAGGVCTILAMMHRPYRVASDIWIGQPPAAVWRILTDTDAFSSWNPSIQRVDGVLIPGHRIGVEIGPPHDTMRFRPVVLEVVPDHVLAWRGGFWPGGILDGEHRFTLKPEGGGTRFVQSESFDGLLVGRLTRTMLADTEGAFRAMNLALKARAEAGDARRRE